MVIQMRNTAFLLCSLFVVVYGKRSARYTMPGNFCGKRTREIDGAIIFNSNSHYQSSRLCVLKFITDDNSYFNREKFMILFKTFVISDCSVKLSLYYDRSSYGPPDVELDCRTVNPPQVLYTPSKRLTLRLDKGNTNDYAFTIVVTKYKEPSGYCSGYRCRNGSHCIDDDLRCDDVPNCLDSDDELNCHYRRSMIGAGMGSIMGISMSSLLCCVLVSVTALVCCRRRRRREAEALTVVHMNKPVEAPSRPPPYDAYQPAPSYGQNYPMQGVPQNYAMTQFYPPPAQPPMTAPPPSGTYPPPPMGAAAIPQYV